MTACCGSRGGGPASSHPHAYFTADNKHVIYNADPYWIGQVFSAKVPEGFLEVSARLGARNVLVMSAEPDETRTVERFVELCDRAAPYGLHVGLEFAIYTGVRTLGDAARVVARSGRANASVLIDALHFSRSGGMPAHVPHVDASLFRYAQICDAAAEMPGPGDTPGLILATGPFLERTGGDWVFVLAQDGRSAERRQIKVGRRTMEQLEILGGLATGERVVTSDYTGFDRIDRVVLTE